MYWKYPFYIFSVLAYDPSIKEFLETFAVLVQTDVWAVALRKASLTTQTEKKLELDTFLQYHSFLDSF